MSTVGHIQRGIPIKLNKNQVHREIQPPTVGTIVLYRVKLGLSKRGIPHPQIQLETHIPKPFYRLLVSVESTDNGHFSWAGGTWKKLPCWTGTFLLGVFLLAFFQGRRTVSQEPIVQERKKERKEKTPAHPNRLANLTWLACLLFRAHRHSSAQRFHLVFAVCSSFIRSFIQSFIFIFIIRH